jgi:hypothetical protein
MEEVGLTSPIRDGSQQEPLWLASVARAAS